RARAERSGKTTVAFRASGRNGDRTSPITGPVPLAPGRFQGCVPSTTLNATSARRGRETRAAPSRGRSRARARPGLPTGPAAPAAREHRTGTHRPLRSAADPDATREAGVGYGRRAVGLPLTARFGAPHHPLGVGVTPQGTGQVRPAEVPGVTERLQLAGPVAE